MNYASIFGPTLLLGVYFNNQSNDIPYLNMLKQLGVKIVVFETNPTFFKQNEARFATDISTARAADL
jgi:Na+(H+)/acetate symporter ActP